MPRRRASLALLVVGTLTWCGFAASARAEGEASVASSEDATALIEHAYALHFEHEQFQAAIDAYEQVAALHPTSPQAAEALFRIANIHHWEFVETTPAMQAYERVIAAYPDTEYAVESILRIGECHSLRNDQETALARYDEVVREHPDSKHVPFALITKAKAIRYRADGRDVAQSIYERLRDEYPDSKYGREARMWLVELRPMSSQRGKRRIEEKDKSREYRVIQQEASDYQLRATAQYMIAYSKSLQGDPVGTLREAQALLVDYAETYDDQLAMTHRLIAAAYERLSRPDLAAEWYEKGATAYPKSLWASGLQDAAVRTRAGIARSKLYTGPADTEPAVITDADAFLDEHLNHRPPAPGYYGWGPLEDHLKAGGGRRALLEAALAIVAEEDHGDTVAALGIVSHLLGDSRTGSPEALRHTAFPVLAAKVDASDDARVRRALVTPLRKTDIPGAATPLIALAEEREWRISQRALDQLAALTSRHPDQLDTITPYLIGRMETELVKMAWTHDRTAAILVRALGGLRDRRALPVLEKALERYPRALADECVVAAKTIAQPRPRLTARNAHAMVEEDVARAKRLRRRALAAQKANGPRVTSSHYRPRSKEMSTDDIAKMFAPSGAPQAAESAGRPAAPLRPDRELTPTETAQRDILLSLVRDAHGRNIPIDDQDDEDRTDRAARVEARRMLAANYLATHIAHDSMVQPVVRFLRRTRDEAGREEPESLPENPREAAYALRSLAATKRVRTRVVEVLAEYASKGAVSALFELLDDPQVAGTAYASLRQLLEPHMGADKHLLGEPGATAGGGRAPNRGELAAAEVWWMANGRRIAPTRRAAHNSD